MYKIYFPLLHPSLTGKTDKDILFLNPGIIKDDSNAIFYTPKALPLSYKESEKYLKQLIQYGEMFKTPGEISQTFLLQLYRGEEETPSHIKAQIKKKEIKSDKKNFPFIGQLTLLLQWFLEENIIELEELNKEIKEDMERLKQSLGELEEDSTTIFLPSNTKKELMKILPWKRLLPWFFLFIEEEHALFVEDNEIIEEWMDYGIELQENKSTKEFIIKDKGWKLLLKNKEIKDMKWLNKNRIIVVRPRGNFL